MSYLQDMRNPFQTHLVGPHMDPWSASRGDIVFTAVRGVAWRGDFIGYLEISASAQVLRDIFTVTTMDGVSAQAILPDGTALFHGRGDAADYSGLSNALGMVHFSLPDGSERLVVRTHSRDLGLDVYVAMDMSVYLARRQEILFSYVMTAAVILAVGVVVIVVMSLGLTASTRRLTRKMKNLSTDNLMAHPEEAISTMVTRRGDREIYHLEQVFNALLRRLQTSHQTEIAVREGALQAQLNALQVQINPHFVYNTLNIISAKGLEYVQNAKSVGVRTGAILIRHISPNVVAPFTVQATLALSSAILTEASMSFLGLSHKDVYKQIVVVQIGATSAATIVGMLIAMILG